MAPLPLQAAWPSSGPAFEPRSLDALRARMGTDPQGALREAARQFETLFMHEVMKSMRSTVLAADDEGSGAVSGRAMSTQMLDGELAQRLSGRLGGLSAAIERQLERQMGLSPGPLAQPAPVQRPASPSPPVALAHRAAAEFAQQHAEAARQAERDSGIPAAFMVSQAALETGWGRREIRHADGSPSFNLFGIKAGGAWKGPVAEVVTTEYLDGRPQRQLAQFRAYGSYAESFADYARLMTRSPRYAAATAAVAQAAGRGPEGKAHNGTQGTDEANAARFAQGLQRAGYATDPDYADKLTRVINTTLRLQRSLT